MSIGSFLRRRKRRILVAALAVCSLLVIAIPNATAASSGASTALWPKFSTPKIIQAVDVENLSSTDLLTAITLQGIYNAQNQPSRLYLIRQADDNDWLTNVPKGIQVVKLPGASNGNTLKMLLSKYLPFIHGAIEVNATNVDTQNLATTMAGLDHAVVISPSQEDLVKSLGIKILYSFNTDEFTNYSNVQTYQWGVDNLLAKSSTKLEVSLPGSGADHIRDYAAATGAFMFKLTSTDPGSKSRDGQDHRTHPGEHPDHGLHPRRGPGCRRPQLARSFPERLRFPQQRVGLGVHPDADGA